MDGFYDGDGKGGQDGKLWKARISPDMVGRWKWRTVSGDNHFNGFVGHHGEFECIEGRDLGGLVQDGKYFRFQSGEFIYLVGNFLDMHVVFSHLFMGEHRTAPQRTALIVRNRDFHSSNKMNVYLANKNDYAQYTAKVGVTPWLGTSQDNDKSRMNLSRWKAYDDSIIRLKQHAMFAELWFFADDSGFGKLSQTEKNRLYRYALARTSAFTHTLYVIALEWQEEWSKESVSASGHYIQDHNPWKRLVSVHSTSMKPWAFARETWPDFIASQAGNSAQPEEVNRYAINMGKAVHLPHIDEEFGWLSGDIDTFAHLMKTLWFYVVGIQEEDLIVGGDQISTLKRVWILIREFFLQSETRMRGNVWANFCGGAAGSGTGSGLKAFQHFLAQSGVPFQRMRPANQLVESGGDARFVLAEIGHHYVVYSRRGSFTLHTKGEGLKGYWFNPRDPNGLLSPGFEVRAGKSLWTPPMDSSEDWVLWITDGSNFNRGISHPTKNLSFVRTSIRSERSTPQ